MLRIEYAFWLCGLLFAVCAFVDARARRPFHTAFWGILAVVLVGGDAFEAMYTAGDKLADQLVGVAVVVLALLAGSGKLKRRAVN